MIAADLFKRNMFPDFKLMAGSGGFNREVTSVSVIDSPDVYRWMRGGEFLVGSGYIFRDNPDEFVSFIVKVAEKRVAAIGIKLDRYHHALQTQIEKTADEKNLPLIQIPLRYRWTDINEIVYRFMEQERRHRLERAPSPTSLWDEGLDIKKILSDCSKAINRKIMAISNPLELNHIFYPDGSIEGTGVLFERIRSEPLQQTPLPSRGSVVIRLEYRDSPPEWQAVYNLIQDFPLTLRVFLEQSETMPSANQERMILRTYALLRAIDIENETTLPDSSAKRERFFEGLCLDIYNDPEMIRINLNELGVVLPSSYRVIVAVSPDGTAFDGWVQPESILHYRLGHFWTGLVACRDGDGSFDHLREGRGEKIFFAIGGIAKQATDISRSYQEASRVIGWIRSSALPTGVYLHEELCLYALFDGIGRLPEAKSVWKRYWEPLRREGQNKKSLSFVELAEALVSSDFNVKLCSQRLHLHYNTVRNYIEDFESFLDIKIADRHHKMGLVLASHIDKSMKK